MGERFLDRDALIDVASRYGQEIVGPPLPPKESAVGMLGD